MLADSVLQKLPMKRLGVSANNISARFCRSGVKTKPCFAQISPFVHKKTVLKLAQTAHFVQRQTLEQVFSTMRFTVINLYKKHGRPKIILSKVLRFQLFFVPLRRI